MKSFEQLGRTAHAAWVIETEKTLRVTCTPWIELRPEVRANWVAVAKAVAAEIATVL